MLLVPLTYICIHVCFQSMPISLHMLMHYCSTNLSVPMLVNLCAYAFQLQSCMCTYILMWFKILRCSRLEMPLPHFASSLCILSLHVVCIHATAFLYLQGSYTHIHMFIPSLPKSPRCVTAILILLWLCLYFLFLCMHICSLKPVLLTCSYPVMPTIMPPPYFFHVYYCCFSNVHAYCIAPICWSYFHVHCYCFSYAYVHCIASHMLDIHIYCC